MENILTEMPKLSGKYRCTMKVYQRYGTEWGATFEAIGAKGAVHYHVSSYKNSDGIISYSSGLEFHYRQPPRYMQDKPPSQDKCHLLQAPCWHDGTSLYASEAYEPLFLRGCYDAIFRLLERDAEEKFNPNAEESEAA